MDTKQEVEEEKTGSVAVEKPASGELQATSMADPEKVEATEATSVTEETSVAMVDDGKLKEAAEETPVTENPKEKVEEEAHVKEDEKKEDGVTNGSTEKTQGDGDGDGDGDVAVAEAKEDGVKDGEMAKESRDQMKEETPVKPVKQTNNLMSKVKSSLVKAKKAIIGKSPPKSSDVGEAKE